jgi:lipopolysaccharide export LptBFGC system permease protein LptF
VTTEPYLGTRLVSPSQNRDLTEMVRQVAAVIYVLAMAAVIVGVDFGFFRHRFWERLMVNIGIVLVFGAFYLRFLMPP